MVIIIDHQMGLSDNKQQQILEQNGPLWIFLKNSFQLFLCKAIIFNYFSLEISWFHKIHPHHTHTHTIITTTTTTTKKISDPLKQKNKKLRCQTPTFHTHTHTETEVSQDKTKQNKKIYSKIKLQFKENNNFLFACSISMNE